MSKKILVIDDEPLILMTVERALTKAGYAVFKAKDREEAKAAIKSAPFDMLIMDLNIKDDSSDDLIRLVAETSPDMKLLRMSGSADLRNPKDFIEKPFRIEDLRIKVKDIFHEPS